jgi:hypothetical protein
VGLSRNQLASLRTRPLATGRAGLDALTLGAGLDALTLGAGPNAFRAPLGARSSAGPTRGVDRSGLIAWRSTSIETTCNEIMLGA